LRDSDVALCTVVFVSTVVGFTVGAVTVWNCAVACCKLALKLPEIVWLTPLDATVCSVGTVCAPPLEPDRPSSCASSWFSSAEDAGAGADGAAPLPATTTSKPGRCTVCETPFTP
jgi:hypothetical protein